MFDASIQSFPTSYGQRPSGLWRELLGDRPLVTALLFGDKGESAFKAYPEPSFVRQA